MPKAFRPILVQTGTMRNGLGLVVILLVLGCGRKTELPKTYGVGYKAVHITDTSRTYKPGTAVSDPLHYRPIDIDIWYPADTAGGGTRLIVRDLFGLLETRANFYTASNAGNGFSLQLAKVFCEGFGCSNPEQLLGFPTGTMKGAQPAQGRFPVVVYMCAYNGMSYENYLLFEALAKKGVMVVSISSIGRFPGDMTMKKEDLMEQVEDAVVALRNLKMDPQADPGRLAVVGYSWGGLAGAVFASKVPGVKCLVSMEGSEFHHYGEAGDENRDFDSIMGMDVFRGQRLSMPYLRLEGAPATDIPTARKDSVYPFHPLHVDNAEVHKIDSMRHEDFDCFSSVVRSAGGCAPDPRYTTAIGLTVNFVLKHLN